MSDISDGSLVVLAGADPVIAGAWAFRDPTDADLLGELVKRGVLQRETDGFNSRGWGATNNRLVTNWEPVGRSKP